MAASHSRKRQEAAKIFLAWRSSQFRACRPASLSLPQGNISCSVSPNEKCALAFPSRPSRLLAFLQISSRSKRRGHRDGTLASAMRAAFWQPRGHAMRGQGEAGRSARARTQFCFWRTKTKTISLEKSWRLQPGMELRTCWRSASPKILASRTSHTPVLLVKSQGSGISRGQGMAPKGCRRSEKR